MSGGIQLSSEMVNDLREQIIKHDASASDDMIFMQYLSAVSAYVLAHQDDSTMDKPAVLNDISSFMGHVLKQVETDMKPPQPAADAFGIWTPEQG
jgi:hypothetical protein